MRDGPLHPRGNPHDSTSILDLLFTHINFISLLRDLSITGTQRGPVWCLVPKCPPTQLRIITTPGAAESILAELNTRSSPEQERQGVMGPALRVSTNP